MYRVRDFAAATIILVISFLVFWRSPIHHMADSRYQLLFSQQLLRNHSFSIEPKTVRECRWDVPEQLWQRGRDYPYHLERFNGRFYYWYPPGTTVLSLPYVAVANALGVSVTDSSGLYDDYADQRLQAILAALLTAGLTVVTFFTARLFLPRWWSVIVSAAAGFSTPLWSTASRTLWTHTWAVFVLGLVTYYVAIVEADRDRKLNRPIILATGLAWLYFIRPALSGSIVAIAIYVLVVHRRQFVEFAVTGCLWLALFIAYSFYHFGTLVPSYYHTGGNLIGFSFEALAGNLISPARGLLVYVPVVLFIGYLAARYCRDHPRLVNLACAAILLQLTELSIITPWHAGHSYGPRYTTDLVPWFALLAILGVEARRKRHATHRLEYHNWRRWTEGIVALVLVGASTFLNAKGALSADVWWWNVRPNEITSHTERLWDWRHPQFLGVPSNSPSTDTGAVQ